eukprot:30816-Pelagococcus_subviridis.AAC.1
MSCHVSATHGAKSYPSSPCVSKARSASFRVTIGAVVVVAAVVVVGNASLEAVCGLTTTSPHARDSSRVKCGAIVCV